MKKSILSILAALVLAGCAGAVKQESEWQYAPSLSVGGHSHAEMQYTSSQHEQWKIDRLREESEQERRCVSYRSLRLDGPRWLFDCESEQGKLEVQETVVRECTCSRQWDDDGMVMLCMPEERPCFVTIQGTWSKE